VGSPQFFAPRHFRQVRLTRDLAPANRIENAGELAYNRYGAGFGLGPGAEPASRCRWRSLPVTESGVEAVMSLFLLRPRVGDLVFQLYGRPLHPELFDICAARSLDRDGFTLTVRITRTGHVISWQRGDVHLTEVAAAVEQSLPESGRLLHRRLRGEQTNTLRRTDSVHYQASFQVEVLPPEIFVHVHDEILADGGKRGLLHNFRPNHRLSLAPLGLITAEARPNCLLLSSFHTFPEEHTVVKSQSLIETRS
jgi:hypothetical protein